MKKVLSILAIGTLLVGCSSPASLYVTSVSDGKDTIVSGEEITVTKNDVYEYFLDQFGSSQVLTMALETVANKEITDQSKIDEKLKQTIEEYTKYMSTDIDSYAKQLGYNNKEEYINDMLLPSAKNELLKDKYIEDNFDTIIKEYKIKYIKGITVDTESEAIDIIDKSKDLDTFNALLSEKSGQDYGMVTTESTIDENIINKFDSFTKDGIYSKAIKTSDDKYAVVYVYNSDITNLKDEIKENLASVSVIKSDCEAHYLKKYKFEVFESKIKDKIEEGNADYLG